MTENRTPVAGRILDRAEAIVKRVLAGNPVDPRLLTWALWMTRYNQRQIDGPMPW